MDNRQIPPSYHRNTPVSRPAPAATRSSAQAANRVAVQTGLWMRTGFVGASIFATGLVSLIADGGQATGATVALAAMAIGGAIAWLSWRSVALLLRRIDEMETAAAATPLVTGRAPVAGPAAGCGTAALVAR